MHSERQCTTSRGHVTSSELGGEILGRERADAVLSTASLVPDEGWLEQRPLLSLPSPAGCVTPVSCSSQSLHVTASSPKSGPTFGIGSCLCEAVSESKSGSFCDPLATPRVHAHSQQRFGTYLENFFVVFLDTKLCQVCGCRSESRLGNTGRQRLVDCLFVHDLELEWWVV